MNLPNPFAPLLRRSPDAAGPDDWMLDEALSVGKISPPAPINLDVQLLGCPAAGKTLLQMSVVQSLESYIGGVRLESTDPRAFNAMRAEMNSRVGNLCRKSIDPTLAAKASAFRISHRGRPTVAVRWTDPVGHVLTEASTGNGDDDPMTRLYGEYMSGLTNTDVMMVMIPIIPRRYNEKDLARLRRNVRSVASFLNHSLRTRRSEKRVAVGIVLSKIDTMLNSPADARTRLTDAMLSESMSDIVRLVNESDRVGQAAIIPISATGFGNTRVLEEPRASRTGDDAEDDGYYGVERPFGLKPGARLSPHNVETLLAWSVWAGTLCQRREDALPGTLNAVGEVVKELDGLLKRESAWWMSIKDSRIPRKPR